MSYGTRIFVDEDLSVQVYHDSDDADLPIGVQVTDSSDGSEHERWLDREEAIEAANAILKALGYAPQPQTATLEARPIGGDVAEAIDKLGDRLVEAIQEGQATIQVHSEFVAPPETETGSVTERRDFTSPLSAQESGSPKAWNDDALHYALDNDLEVTFLYQGEGDLYPIQRRVEIEDVDSGRLYALDAEDNYQYKQFRLDRISGYVLVVSEEPVTA